MSSQLPIFQMSIRKLSNYDNIVRNVIDNIKEWSNWDKLQYV